MAVVDAALLVAVPLSRAEFGHRVLDSDWLGKFRPARAPSEAWEQALDESWNDEYGPLVGEPVAALVKTAGELGVDVHTAATLDDLRGATASRGIVALFAHWKGAEVEYDDVLGGRERFVEACARKDAPLARWIAADLAKAGRGVDETLNAALECPLPSSSGDIEVREHPATRNAGRRDEMDRMFSGLLRPGNCLELYDGLHDKWAVDRAIAPGFSGILDLTACNSTVLGGFLAGRRGHAMRTVQFPQFVEFIWAATCLSGTLRLVASGQFEYQEARLVAKQLLGPALQDARRLANGEV